MSQWIPETKHSTQGLVSIRNKSWPLVARSPCEATIGVKAIVLNRRPRPNPLTPFPKGKGESPCLVPLSEILSPSTLLRINSAAGSSRRSRRTERELGSEVSPQFGGIGPVTQSFRHIVRIIRPSSSRICPTPFCGQSKAGPTYLETT